MKKKILIVTYKSADSGGPFYVANQITNLLNGSHFYRVKKISLSVKYFFRLRKFDNFLNKFDVVHFNNFFNILEVIAFYRSLRLGISTVISLHSNLSKWSLNFKKFQKYIYLFFFKKILSLCDNVHLLTEFEKKDLFDTYPENFNKPNIYILPNFLKIGDYSINRKKNFENLKFLYFSRIDVKKGIFELIEAINILKHNSDIKFSLSVVGFGKPKIIKKIQKLINKYKLDNYINIERPITTYAEKKKMFNEHNLFILPSYDEGDSVALKEAIYSGMDCLITKNCNCYYKDEFSEIIHVMEDNTPSNIAKHLKYYYEKIHNNNDLSEIVLKEKISNFFDEKKYINALNNLYKKSILKDKS